MRLLGGSSAAGFLRRHWQKKPLLVRGAFPGFRDPVSAEALSAWACAPEVESRLVLERGGRRPWQVEHGPFSPARLRRLPRTHWTLLVQGVDALDAHVAALLDRFRFLPAWRLDDVMVSYAVPSGGVGPHADGYDVFLIQGAGRRRWRIATRFAPALIPGLELQVLRRFRAEREWVLEPGDMLYLPPGVAHHGVALAPSLTYSVGFRAPSHADLAGAFAREALEASDRSARYGDAGLRVARHPGEIDRAALGRMRRIVARALDPGPAFVRAVGTLVTEPKRPLAPGRRVTSAQVRARVLAGRELLRMPASRVAYARHGPRGAELFADGAAFALPRGLGFAAPLLSGSRRIQAETLLRHLRRPGFAELLAALIGQGAFRLVRPGSRAHPGGVTGKAT